MSTPQRESVELDISWMTCASCAARIAKKLNKVAGVQASVNYVTEKATVLYPTLIRVEDLIAVVENAGYLAALPDPEFDLQGYQQDQQKEGDVAQHVKWGVLG